MSNTPNEKPNLWSKEHLTQLVETYRFPLLYFITGIMGDFTDAEDVVEDTFARLLFKKPRLKNENAVKTYLFTTAKNIATDYLRKMQRNRKQQQTLSRFTEKDKEFIEDKICQTETERELTAALHTLASDAREILYLQYFEGLTPKEIAKVTGKSVKQIYNVTARAKKSLAEKLQKENTVDENERRNHP